MRFVDRKNEMSRLQQLLKADTPSFIIIPEEDLGNSLLPADVLRML